MAEVMIVFCTCQSTAEAERIANTLVEERLAACVNILSPIQSVYRWQDAVERAAEIQLLIKTAADRFSALRQRILAIHSRILAIHSYETPEIVAVRVAEGSAQYLAWIDAAVH